MENRDLKDVFKTVREKKKREKMEKLLLYLAGVLLVLIFVAIGLNIFPKDGRPISEPEVKIVKDINQPVATPQIPTQQQQQNKPVLENQPQEVKLPEKDNTLEGSNTDNKNQHTEEKLTEKPKEKEQSKISHNEKPQEKEKDSKQSKDKIISQEKGNKKDDSKSIVSMIRSGFFSIQVGAFSTKEKAMTEKSKYPQAFIVEEEGLYKVLVGRFETDKEAREYKNAKGIDGFIKRLRD